ncbi:hypothetical protein LTR64_003022 [Lithohypha guttulata]|uniref:uncharacterized protein n=1 Tax=Lithohypha guttulata TaxID=1690604 RepID=UPI002DE0A5B0|nr:hypothetical protein LTR51_000754 [Lithohypha guttulata]
MPSSLPAPFAEPLLPQLDVPNPFLTEKHHKVRAYTRNFVEKELLPYAQEWETAGEIPDYVRQKYSDAGFTIVHPVIDKEDAGGVTPIAGIPHNEWDTWCGMIVGDEMNRMGWCGVSWGLNGGNGIGAPPVSRFGTKEQRARWLPKIARGEIRFCLGITEPDGGSDVANIRTTAERQGDKYIVNGSKKWITGAIWADYVTAAVRTGGNSHGGISLLVIPLNAPGVTRRRMYNQGVHASGSTFITFEDVEVPVDHLLGKENDGFRLIMSNFNPERLSLATAAIRLSRVCVQDAYDYACKRETFGKKLIEHDAIRAKFAKFGQLIEPCQAFLDQLCYVVETSCVTGKEVNVGGMTALLKVMSTRCLEKCCREAQQIFGGAGYNKSGPGARVEQISRDVRVHVVGGGSEEIMSSLAVRQEARDVQLRAKKSKI